jgi:ComF family protein
MGLAVKEIALRALSWLVALPCPLCGGRPADGVPNALCEECLAKLCFPREPLCPGCGGELDGILEVCQDCLKSPKRPWTKAVSAMLMKDGAEELIHRFKYRGRPDLARVLGAQMTGAFLRSGIKADFICPTPLHWTRLLGRGYDQAQLLSEALSAGTGLPVLAVLKRSRRTPRQAKLSRVQRFENLKGAFSVPDSTPCLNRSILLVDDVMTTGSTLSVAAEALAAAGAREISVIVAARRQRD